MLDAPPGEAQKIPDPVGSSIYLAISFVESYLPGLFLGTEVLFLTQK